MPKIPGNFISLWIWLVQVEHTKNQSKSYGGASKGPINPAFRKNHHTYVCGLRTKEVIGMRELLAEMDKSFLARP